MFVTAYKKMASENSKEDEDLIMDKAVIDCLTEIEKITSNLENDLKISEGTTGVQPDVDLALNITILTVLAVLQSKKEDDSEFSLEEVAKIMLEVVSKKETTDKSNKNNFDLEKTIKMVMVDKLYKEDKDFQMDKTIVGSGIQIEDLSNISAGDLTEETGDTVQHVLDIRAGSITAQTAAMVADCQNKKKSDSGFSLEQMISASKRKKKKKEKKKTKKKNKRKLHKLDERRKEAKLFKTDKFHNGRSVLSGLDTSYVNGADSMERISSDETSLSGIETMVLPVGNSRLQSSNPKLNIDYSPLSSFIRESSPFPIRKESSPPENSEFHVSKLKSLVSESQKRKFITDLSKPSNELLKLDPVSEIETEIQTSLPTKEKVKISNPVVEEKSSYKPKENVWCREKIQKGHMVSRNGLLKDQNIVQKEELPCNLSPRFLHKGRDITHYGSLSPTREEELPCSLPPRLLNPSEKNRLTPKQHTLLPKLLNSPEKNRRKIPISRQV